MSVIDYEQIWAGLPFPAFVIDQNGQFEDANTAAEQFLKISLKQMRTKAVLNVFGPDSVISETVEQAGRKNGTVMQYNVDVGTAETPPTTCNVHVGPFGGALDQMLLLIQPTGVAQKMSRSITHMAASRSVVAMAAMLAHEIRNPLAGISGAAQLLAMGVEGDDLGLTKLIEDEARRIGQLVDRVEHFADDRPTARRSVNIHDVLDRSIRSGQAGFAQNVSFSVDYDPSLPDVAGDGDQLLQVFQNLMKNASEAFENGRGRIKVRTSYNSGVKFTFGGNRTENLPLQIEVIDNGRGIPNSIISDIFEPFVTSKANGSGLGLPLVSKIIAGHGGLIECNSMVGRTVFTVRLPIWRQHKRDA